MKQKILSVMTALALCLSLWPGTVLAADPTGTDLDLSNQDTDSGSQVEGYQWKPVLDESDNPPKITGGTLTLSDGFKAGKVTLPDAEVTVVTGKDCEIGTLTTGNAESGSPSIQLTFSGTGNLTVTEHIELSGGDDNSLTVAEGTAVTAKNGITIGSSGGVNSTITVNGTLTIEQGRGVSAICAGKVMIGKEGHLEVTGRQGVTVNGNPKENHNQFTGAFAIERGGTFQADCSEYNIIVDSGKEDGFLAENIDVKQIIKLDESYWPSTYVVKKDILSQIITFAKPNDTVQSVNYKLVGAASGKFALHEIHDWSDVWSIDNNKHWYACKFAGCDKKLDEAAHIFNNGACTCGAQLTATLTGTDSLIYDGTVKEPAVSVTISIREEPAITLTAGTDYSVTYADNTNAGTGKVTVTGIGSSWTVEKTFFIQTSPLTIKANNQSITYGGRIAEGLDQVTCAPDSLAAGDTLESVTLTPSTSNVPGGSITPSNVKIINSSKEDVTANYEITYSPGTLTIQKATHGDIAATTEGKYGAAKTYDPAGLLPEGYQLGAITIEDTNGIFSSGPTVSDGGQKLQYTLADNAGNAGKRATITVPVTSANYGDFDLTITVTVLDKYAVALEVPDITISYGQTPQIHGTATGNNKTLTGRWSFTGAVPVNVPGGDVTVQFVPDDTDEYKAPPDVTVHLTIEPAPLTVQAQSYTIVRGSPLPPDFAYTVTGLVNGDLREDVLDETQIAVNCGADGQTAGRFDITVSGGALKSGNYKLEYVPGTLTVETPYVPPTPSHTHNWSTAWSCDGVGHWHECLNSGCDIQRRDYAGHIYDDGQDAMCNICGYVREVEPPEPEHVHDWAAAWSTDDAYHWHECLAEGCGITDDSQKDGYSLHVYDDEQDEECSICGYVREVAPPEPEHVHNWAAEWSTDDAYHWHECLAEDCGITADGEKDGYGVHVYDDEWDTACNVCGYVREVEPPVPEHVHAWDRVWSGDSAHHWHECLAGGCGITVDSEKDGYGGHIPGGWIIDGTAAAGRRYRACTVCGRVLETESIPPSGGGSSVRTYAVMVEMSEHGRVTSSRSYAASGTAVTLTVAPDAGYVLLDLAVTDSQGSPVSVTDQNTFTMPDRAVTVKASFAPLPDENQEKSCDGGGDCPSGAYADLSTSAWYHEAVDYAIREGLLTGYGDGMFHPNGTLSRAQLAQILYNREGRPAVAGGSGFTDVAPDSWYANAVIWAAAQGIVGGYGNGEFGPDDSVTREQLAVMLWRYSKRPAAAGGELHFSDAHQANSWALEALRWAAENGVLNGKGNGVLDPGGLTSRAETAQMLQNSFGSGEENT